jgi:hypothetical protein
MSAVLKMEVEYELSTCSECGVTFGLPAHYRRKRRQDHHTFYCPNGHSQYFPSETEAEKLRKELERERQRTVAAQNQTRMEREQREKLERKMKRVDKGTCPECNRHFANVERHMKSKHAQHSATKKATGVSPRPSQQL